MLNVGECPERRIKGGTIVGLTEPIEAEKPEEEVKASSPVEPTKPKRKKKASK